MLNLEQKAIIESKEPRILINAGAGTGKTTTLIAAAEQHKDERIALITFTNEAAAEIMNRLSFKPAFVGTLHKFSYQLLLLMAEKYNLTFSLLREYQIKEVLDYILQEKNYPISLTKEVLEFITDKRKYTVETVEIPSYYRFLAEEYEKLKEKTRMYDITDSPVYLYKKLLEYPLDIPYDYLFVDEAQDLSTEEFNLINFLSIKNKFIIGDPKQSIYIFRGADSSVFENFQNNNYKEYKLTYNYRSYQEILDYAGAGLKAIRGMGGIKFSNLKECLALKPHILCRSNIELNKIKKYYSDISTIHAAKGLEYDNVLLCNFKHNTLEEQNVYYVALTRAKNGIGIFPFEKIKKQIKFC